ncbi:MAG: hypothetical protein ACRED4_02400 [Brevundimonas sp.]
MMCERAPTPPGRGRRFPGGRFPDRGLTAPRPMSIPAPHRSPPAKLVETFDGEPADAAQGAP